MKGAHHLHLGHFIYPILCRWEYFTIECQKKNISDINEVKHCALDSGIFIIYGNWRRFNVAQTPFMKRTGLLLGCSFLEDSHVNYRVFHLIWTQEWGYCELDLGLLRSQRASM